MAATRARSNSWRTSFGTKSSMPSSGVAPSTAVSFSRWPHAVAGRRPRVGLKSTLHGSATEPGSGHLGSGDQALSVPRPYSLEDFFCASSSQIFCRAFVLLIDKEELWRSYE